MIILKIINDYSQSRSNHFNDPFCKEIVLILCTFPVIIFYRSKIASDTYGSLDINLTTRRIYEEC